MGSNNTTLIAYHGTEAHYADNIVKFKNFPESLSDEVWLGTGVYFFINKVAEKAITTAMDWCKYIRRYTIYSIMEAKLNVCEDNIMDLNDPEWEEFYQEVMEEYVKKIVDNSLHIENSSKLDCAIINDICDNNSHIHIVIQRRYVNFIKHCHRDIGLVIPSSNVPNCTIICVKNRGIIDKKSIRIVKGDLRYEQKRDVKRNKGKAEQYVHRGFHKTS